ncbi:MAG: type IV pilus twitching motility protein PilT [Candidatus Aureabacteria bacterium]|nr:type IV pilus twitching motility protein PilT [Candidatus Auribacterota bacterium]
MAIIDILFKEMIEKHSSDLHLVPGEPPMLRIDGEIVRLTHHETFSGKVLSRVLLEILDEKLRDLLFEHKEMDFAYSLENLARFRCNYFYNSNGLAGVFRVIPEKIYSLDDLDLPQQLKKILTLNRGLVLVTGPTGSGKTTTLSAIVDYINSNKDGHIITIEEPIEFIHKNKRCLISQRQVGADVNSFPKALKSALREDPNVILVGELRDCETISLALTAAETGILVLATLHTNSASKTINRIVSAFPQKQQNQIRTMLAGSLKAIIAQQLLKKKDQSGRIAAVEILFANPAVANIVRKNRSYEIESILETSKDVGMQSIDEAISIIYQQGLITLEEARSKAFDKTKFIEFDDEEDS